MAEEGFEDIRFRSREEVLAAIEDLFHTTAELDDTGIEVVYQARPGEGGCGILLKGEVGSENERQLARLLISDVLGIPDVDNRLHVSESLREDAPGFNKAQSDDTDYLGETLEAIDEGVVNDEFGYIPPDHPIPETTTDADADAGQRKNK